MTWTGDYRADVQFALFFVALILTFRTFVYEPFKIPSGSMIPTLLVGDYLFVSKYSY
ncbi:MAG: signal peptidase I, partial [Magnetococcales bacterium]|nr:signal peptidase I [Magnetococcales bacterium]